VTPVPNGPISYTAPPVSARSESVSPARAVSFVADAEARLAEANGDQQRAAWVAENFITHDTQILAAKASEKQIALGVELAKQSAHFDDARNLPYDVRRKLDLIKLALTTPGPGDPGKTAEMARIGSELDAMYGAGKYRNAHGDVADINDATRVMRTSRQADELLDAWRGWHSVARPMKARYTRFVALTNEGARELGYRDAGAMWRSKYDMPPEAFEAEIDRLWDQVRPLYVSLHAYVRTKLTRKYGTSIVAPGRPIPAHLFGNIWAQEWANIYDVVAPENAGASDIDLTEVLKARHDIDEVAMVRFGERFFTSLGFDPLPPTFWDRSLFTKPRDREVVCHASAWDIDDHDDLRVKMCIEKTADDFTTIHHELGHNFYQRAYKHQPFLYKNSANDGFHEAVGDTIALSVTPGYLVQAGLIDREPSAASDIALLLRDALDKIAFLPFGIMIDKWRWKVFSGEVGPAEYNDAWWELRLRYQGIAPPLPRTDEDFDAGAKYHIASNVPYARYFLARILQFQFHRALCRAAGQRPPLNRASIYGNHRAGQLLNDMMAMGQSRPWPDALEALSGERRMDATAILDYFAPLSRWLDEQNRGAALGW
jgi:peptidyl-dipeptidase A